MGFFSSLFSRAPRPIRLSLPARDAHDCRVYFRCDGPPPSPGELEAVAFAWIDANVDEPLRTRVRRALEKAPLSIDVKRLQDTTPPPKQIVDYLSPPGWIERLEPCTHVAIVGATTEPMNPPVALVASLAAARGIALAKSGCLLEPLIPRFAKEETFTERFSAEWTFRVTDHVVLPFSVDGRGRGWLTSVGLARFGLPEIEVRDVPAHVGNTLMPVINGLALHLLEKAWSAPVDGGERRLELDMPRRVSWGDILAAMGGRDDGTEPPPFTEPLELALEHRRNRLSDDFLRVVRPDGVKVSHSEWLAALIAPLAGDDPIYETDADSAEAMARAHETAVEQLPAMRERFRKGLAPGEVFFVKKPFAADGGNEYMWITVQEWSSPWLAGILASTPQHVPGLAAGQQVRLHEDEVFDWCWKRADGSIEGAFTDKVAQGA